MAAGAQEQAETSLICSGVLSLFPGFTHQQGAQGLVQLSLTEGLPCCHTPLSYSALDDKIS